ncbi:MAG TPA: hypothetical protein VMQ76_07250 [Terracidiphilus sp.]|nr:hypothetical protein [Terracidiphilus sp.]
MTDTISTIPTESLQGCVIRQLYHGRPHLVFVQHERPDNPPRACFEVTRNGPGGFKPKGKRMDWTGNVGTDAAELCAEYLQQTYERFA